MYHEFNLENLGKLDGGRVAIAWQQALERIAADCSDRPGVGKARKLSLELDVKPDCDENGFCDTISVAFSVKESMPSRQSKPYELGVRQKAGKFQMVFSELSEDDVDQTTLGFGDEHQQPPAS